MVCAYKQQNKQANNQTHKHTGKHPTHFHRPLSQQNLHTLNCGVKILTLYGVDSILTFYVAVVELTSGINHDLSHFL